MYLNRAEAYFELGNETAHLMILRDPCGQDRSFVPGTESVGTLTAIKTERRKELAFEGHRFFDLKRWDKTEMTAAEKLIREQHATCLPAAVWALPFP